MKRVPIGSSSPYAFDEDARTRLKHQGLMQDYVELQKETNATKKKLQKAKQKKLTLMAEVGFLRRRYQYLMKIQSLGPPLEPDLARTQITETRRESLKMERNHRDREVALPNSYPVLDLNLISNGEDEEEAEEFRGFPERLTMEKDSKKLSSGVEKDSEKIFSDRGGEQHLLPPLPSSDLKLSVCRDIGKGSNRAAGKRKISWQDPVALRV